MTFIKKASIALLGLAGFIATSCKNNLDRFQDFKEENPAKTRIDFITQEINDRPDVKQRYHVGSPEVQRTERVYGYHYGYSAWKGKFCWHHGSYTKNRENTPAEKKQDSINYAARRATAKHINEAYAGYLDNLAVARGLVARLATTKTFNHVAEDDGKTDSLDIKVFSRHAHELARICGENNNKLVIIAAPDAPPQEPKSYDDTYKQVAARLRRSRNETVRVQVKRN